MMTLIVIIALGFLLNIIARDILGREMLRWMLGKKLSAKIHFTEKLIYAYKRGQDEGFTTTKVEEIREGIRTAYDKLNERLESVRMLKGLIQKYGTENAIEIQKRGPEYANTALREGEEAAIKRVIPKAEPTKYLSEKDNTAIENLQRAEEGVLKDIEQKKQQMDELDKAISGEGGQLEKIEGWNSTYDLIKEHRRKI